MAKLLYGSGLRLMECVRLRVKDLDFGQRQIVVREGKGMKDRNREWLWQYVFPSDRLSNDPRSDTIRRHHVDESGLQKAVRQAARQAGLTKPANVLTPSATALPPTCSSRATTFVPCRNFSATPT